MEDLMAKVAGWITGDTKTVELADRIRSEFHVGRDKAADVIRQLERNGFVRGKTKTKPAYATIAPPTSLASVDIPPKQRGLGGMT